MITDTFCIGCEETTEHVDLCNHCTTYALIDGALEAIKEKLSNVLDTPGSRA